MTIAKKIATALFTVSLAATFVGCASTSTKEGTGEFIDDSVITTKVKAAIVNEPTLKATEINVAFAWLMQTYLSFPVNALQRVLSRSKFASAMRMRDWVKAFNVFW